jgi:hypothetical protein
MKLQDIKKESGAGSQEPESEIGLILATGYWSPATLI